MALPHDDASTNEPVHIVVHLLVLAEVSFDMDWHCVVVYLAGVQQLLQELAISLSALNQSSRHLWGY